MQANTYPIFLGPRKSERVEARCLHSARLLPHYDALKAHLDSLETRHPPAFAKPPHLRPIKEGLRALLDACEKVFESELDQAVFEEHMRWFFRTKVSAAFLS